MPNISIPQWLELQQDLIIAPLVQDSPTSPINDLVVAYQPPNNGTVVQCWDNTHWANAALQPMIVNTLNWMSSLAIISSILYPITPNPSYDGNVHLNSTQRLAQLPIIFSEIKVRSILHWD